MKINKLETYSIDELSKDELVFILEVIDKIQLTEDSTPLSFEIAKRFKQMRKSLEIESSDSEEPRQEDIECNGCPTTDNVEIRPCPISKQLTPLCNKCFKSRVEIETTDG